MQAGLTCTQFLQITSFTFNKHNLFIPLSNLEFFSPLDFSQGKLQNAFKHESNGTIYEELKLKKRN